jgi:hypothetical protein
MARAMLWLNGDAGYSCNCTEATFSVQLIGISNDLKECVGSRQSWFSTVLVQLGLFASELGYVLTISATA